MLFALRWPAAPEGFPPVTGRDLDAQMREAFAALMRRYELNAEAFWKFKAECGYAGSYRAYMGPDLLNEKLLEHWVSLELLQLKLDDVLIDVGSAVSPFSVYVAQSVGCKAYSLDLDYPPGVNGNRIGCSADSIPMPDQSVSAITLHCTIDHFEGNADRGFVREAARILRPGGRVCILPLYVAENATNICDPKRFAPRPKFDAGAIVRRVAGYGNRFGRFYSVETLRDRLLEPGAELRPTIYSIEGDQPKVPNNYLHYALVLEKPGRGKTSI